MNPDPVCMAAATFALGVGFPYTFERGSLRYVILAINLQVVIMPVSGISFPCLWLPWDVDVTWCLLPQQAWDSAQDPWKVGLRGPF